MVAVGSVPGAEPERSVIQILTFSQQPVWDAPWRFESVRRSGGSGFVIKGKRIMTNAHVVSWGKEVVVRRYQDPRPYLARVKFIAHDCDIALLEVEDEGFFSGLEPLRFGDLPKVRSTVVTYGYPAGGEQISYTRGLVPLQNPAYRNFLKLPDNDLGARVDSLLPIPTTEKLIQPDDVLLRVGKYEIGSDGTVVYEGNRVSASAAFQTAQRNENLLLKIWRQGKEIEVSLPMNVYTGDRNVGNQYDVLPRYFVYAGLVFTPLSLDYMRTLGQGWRDGANAELTYELYYRRGESAQSARPEPIVLSSILAHPVNANFKITRHALVDKINGLRIDKLEDVVRAFESATNTHHVIEVAPNHSFETLNRADAVAMQGEILKTYGVPKDRRL